MSHCNCECCSHEHHHEHNHHENNRLTITLLIVSAILFLIMFFLPNPFKTAVAILSAILCGYEVFLSALKSLVKFEINEKLLLLVAVVAAFILGEVYEAVAVTILFNLGEIIEHIALKTSQKNIDELLKIAPKTANRILKDKTVEVIDVEKINVGDILLIKVGEKVPVDCKIISGCSSFDTRSVTGESLPSNLKEGDKVFSASVNLSGAVEVCALSTYETSTVNKIVELVKMSSQRKSNAQKLVTRFAKIYTPAIMILAIIVAFFPPLVLNLDFKTWIYRALVFLVASCPCAIVISVPLAFFGAIGNASKNGIFIKGTRDIEALSKADTFVFDKTGTLTTGKFKVSNVLTFNNYAPSEIITVCANVEKFSNHPIANAIVDYAGEFEVLECKDVTELSGIGISATVNGKKIVCGNKRILPESVSLEITTNANVYVLIDDILSAVITVEDTLKTDAPKTVSILKQMGIKKTVILTGDTKDNAVKVQKNCDVDECYDTLLPQQKVEIIEKIKQNSKSVAFVGDGINDAPVLSASDVGIAVGSASDIACESADVVLMTDSLLQITKAIKISCQTMNTVKFNIFFALAFKCAVLILDIFGLSNMWLAVVADVGVTIITSLLAISILRKK